MKEIEKLNYVSFGLAMGIASAIFGLTGAIISLVGFVIDATGFLEVIGLTPLLLYPGLAAIVFGLGREMGVISIMLYPIVSFIGGFIWGIIVALIYNFFLHKYLKIKAK